MPNALFADVGGRRAALRGPGQEELEGHDRALVDRREEAVVLAPGVERCQELVPEDARRALHRTAGQLL